MEVLITAALTTAAFAMPFIGRAIAKMARARTESVALYDPTCHIRMANNLRIGRRQAS